jgi:hypothetical protein
LFVDAYYTISPGIADDVAVSPFLASVVRAVIAVILQAIKSPAVLAIVPVLVIGVLALASSRRRRYKERTSV